MTIRVYLCEFVFTNFLRVSACFCVTLSKTTIKNSKKNIMATKKTMVRTAKRANKKAIIVAMTAITGATLAQETAAYEQAMRDMKQDGFTIQYTYDPFDGMLA